MAYFIFFFVSDVVCSGRADHVGQDCTLSQFENLTYICLVQVKPCLTTRPAGRPNKGSAIPAIAVVSAVRWKLR
jgi:hypothetical protein